MTACFCIFYFMNNSYQVFMSPASITQGVGGVLTNFGDAVFAAVTKGLPVILLFHLPVIFYHAVLKKHVVWGPGSRRLLLSLLLCGVLLFVCSGLGLSLGKKSRAKYTYEYSFDTAVRSFGLTSALELDTRYSLFGVPEYRGTGTNDTPEDPAQDPTQGRSEDPGEDPAEDPQIEEPPKPVVYGWNVQEIDFDALVASASDKTLKSVFEYLSTAAPTRQNPYTGMFKGKNLILITAEAFSLEVVDPVRTPTLYRMMTKGIYCKDFYQPSWGGSTSTGEASVLSGIIPTVGVKAMKLLSKRDLRFTINKRLLAQDPTYTDACFHNGDYKYYDRDQTHPAFYSTYTGMGNGLEEGVRYVWPESDDEMFRFTVPQYLDKQPFSLYYMTVSGHCGYGWTSNSMSKKNRELYDGQGLSERIAAYYACNQELEYAMASLVQILEDAGIADDTVVAMTADHYPYGLEKSATWQNEKDYLEELYGYPPATVKERDHNGLILWSGCLEKLEEPIVIDTPAYSLDILPTLCNLFGVDYDSRLLVGRDLLDPEAQPLVIWPNHTWITDKGFYNSANGKFTPSVEGEEVSDEYIAEIKRLVRNKINYSAAVFSYDLFPMICGD